MKHEKIVSKYRQLVPTKKKGTNLYHMTKTELVRLVQTTEGNSPCYKGDFAKSCGQTDCCFFKDCRDNRK